MDLRYTCKTLLVSHIPTPDLRTLNHPEAQFDCKGCDMLNGTQQKTNPSTFDGWSLPRGADTPDSEPKHVQCSHRTSGLLQLYKYAANIWQETHLRGRYFLRHTQIREGGKKEFGKQKEKLREFDFALMWGKV